jgi:hypothetical protein
MGAPGGTIPGKTTGSRFQSPARDTTCFASVYVPRSRASSLASDPVGLRTVCVPRGVLIKFLVALMLTGSRIR